MDELITPGTGGAPTDFSLGPVFSPLEPHKNDINFLTDITDVSNNLDGSYNAHTKFRLHTLTNQPMIWGATSDGSFTPLSAGGPSIDHLPVFAIG